MNRRSFITAFAGLPFVGGVVGMLGLSKSKAKGGITVHGPEVIVVHDAYNKPKPTLSLRFEHVPLRENLAIPAGEVLNRLRSLFGTVNRSDWHWYGAPASLPCLNIKLAQTMMFTDIGVSPPENGLCTVVCAFTPALDRRPWPGSHRPVDFEAEILKALTAG